MSSIVKVDFSKMAEALLNTALELATKYNIPIFPCRPDKRPYTHSGFHDATTDPDTIQGWWSKWPFALIGVSTGKPSGLLAIDIDPKGKTWLVKHQLDLRGARVHKTPRGYHFLFKDTGEDLRCSAGKIAEGVDVRANGGYIIWWPAVGFKAKRKLELLVDPPRWLIAMLLNMAANETTSPIAETRLPKSTLVSIGSRNDYLSRQAFKLRKSGSSITQIEKILMAMNEAWCDPPLDPKELAKIAIGKKDIAVEQNNSEWSIELTRGKDVKIEPINWLWNGWLASGKLHMLAGSPGTGKTTIALSLAAITSNGSSWPDGSINAKSRNILIWSGEDDPQDTLLPRLKAMGADTRKIFFIGDMKNGTSSKPFDLSKDIHSFIDKANEVGDIGLIVIDPVVMISQGDSHKNAEVRRDLMPLNKLAIQLKTAVLGITHFSKGSASRDPIDRLTGSLAFGAAPRIVFAATKQMDSETRVFARVKSNIGPDGDGIEYILVQTALTNEIFASGVVWGKKRLGTARDILADAEGNDSDAGGASALEEAKNFLSAELSNGPVTTPKIFEEAERHDISKASLRRAKKLLQVVATKDDMKSGWKWSLP